MKKVALGIVIVLLLGVTGKYFLLPTLAEDVPKLAAWLHRDEGAQGSQAGGEAAASGPEDGEHPVAPHPADAILAGMTREEKVGQLFFARCPEDGVQDEISRLHPAGYVLFARDFENETRDSVRSKIESYQQESAIPLLVGVDEEGGTVVRVSKYEAFRRWPFQSPQQLNEEAGQEAFVYDTAEKDKLLKDLGINVNLAPVCDVVTAKGDYMYKRALGAGPEETAAYVRTVVTRMQQDGMGAVLKHFPGYGPNGNTHDNTVTDTRSLETYQSRDFVPFEAGIEAGAGGVLVSHIIVSSMDGSAPASLSPKVHEILRSDLNFTGVILTDPLGGQTISAQYDEAEAAILALTAGADMLYELNDPEGVYTAILSAIQNGELTEERIDESVTRILCAKLQLQIIES